MNQNVKSVVDVACSWQDRYFSEANYGASPYCASFVRYVFRQALGNSGELPIVYNPPHYQKLGLKYPVGLWFADSMAGDEVGPAVPTPQMAPGDLLFFQNTYPGWAAGTITHIGVCVGGNGLMADAGSGSLVHVRNHAVYFPGLLVEVRRPKCLGSAVNRTKIALNNGNFEACLHNQRAWRLETQISFEGGVPKVQVNGQAIKPSFVTVDVVVGGEHTKLFFHNQRAQALIDGAQAGKLQVVAKMDAMLHVWVNGKEVKPASLLIEIVE